MHHAAWKNLADFPNVREDFSHAASWAKAEIVPAQGQRFNYYSYAVEDCLLTHDDTD
jgi:hypothetical protein